MDRETCVENSAPEHRNFRTVPVPTIIVLVAHVQATVRPRGLGAGNAVELVADVAK